MRPPCTRCGTTGGYRGRRARGLCQDCYHIVWAAGQLDNHERTSRTRNEVLTELDLLGFNPRLPVTPQLRSLAPRIGMTFAALERAWRRAHTERNAA